MMLLFFFSAHEATPEQAASGDFPLSRYLYVYVNKRPNQALAPLDREFVKLMLSKQGQEVVNRVLPVLFGSRRTSQL